jgi:hypothetical protein
MNMWLIATKNRCDFLVVQAATLGNWFSGLLQRQDQLARWLTMGRPRAYWLTGFFNPQVGGSGGL